MRASRPGRRSAILLLTVVLLAGCGGGSGSGDTTGQNGAQITEPTGPGRLERATALNVIARADITAATQAADSRTRTLVPLYDVANHRIEYLTIDAQGREIVASGLVSVPVKAAGARSPVLGYQHGTTFIDAEAPSNHAMADEAAVILASLGYIVVAPDYVGYGVSKGAPHPYLLAAPTAAATLDLLTAAQTWRRRAAVTDNGQLFLTGYSEGGYATVAAHRAMQFARSAHLANLRAVVAGAGPYDVKLTLDALLERVRDEVPLLAPLLDPDVLRFLSDTDRNRLRDELMKRLRPTEADVVFDNTMIDRYLADEAPLIELFSNVHDWAPALALRLFHGRDDETVPIVAGEDAVTTMRSRGAADVTLTICTAVPASHIGCVPEFLQFVLAEFAKQARDL